MKKQNTLRRTNQATKREKTQPMPKARVNGGQPRMQAESPQKGKLDTITFIYGFGAAVVLVGAMFKFLGWPFANELFIIGLSIEAVVFLISAFERKEEEIEYKWENVFPQLQSEGETPNMNGSYANAMDTFAQTLGEMTNNIQHLSDSLQEIRHSMRESAASSQEMRNQMGEFNDLMEHYNENLKTINSHYDEVMRQ